MSDFKKDGSGKPPVNQSKDEHFSGTDKTVKRISPPRMRKELPLTESGHLPPPVLDTTSAAPKNSEMQERTDPLIGMTFKGKYTIEERLGEGGQAVVYKARSREEYKGQTVIDKQVAIKIMNPLPSGNENEELDSEEQRRMDDDKDWGIKHFIREIQIATTLEHENIVRVMDFIVTEDDRLGCVMEYVKGSDLQGIIYNNEKGMGFQRFIDLSSQACAGLQYAHEKGIIHRDIKPANILITKSNGNETAKVNDFGLARNRNAATHETVAGEIFGTFQYAPPEQVKGEKHDDPRMDVYSMGVTMYEMLCKQVPFDQKSYVDLQRAIVYDMPQEPKSIRGDIPDELNQIIMRCLEKDPAKRFQTMRELRSALTGYSRKVMAAPTGRLTAQDAIKNGLQKKLITPAKPLKDADKKAIPQETGDESQDGASDHTAVSLPARREGNSRRPFLIGGTLAAVIAVAGTIIALTGSLQADKVRNKYRHETVPSEMQVLKPEEAAGDTGIPMKEPAEEIAPAHIAPPAIENAERKVHKITVKTDPDGVEILISGKSVCVTKADSCVLELEESNEPAMLTLTKPGFARMSKKVVPDKDKELELALKPLQTAPLKHIVEPKKGQPDKPKEPEHKPSITSMD